MLLQSSNLFQGLVALKCFRSYFNQSTLMSPLFKITMNVQLFVIVIRTNMGVCVH